MKTNVQYWADTKASEATKTGNYTYGTSLNGIADASVHLAGADEVRVENYNENGLFEAFSTVALRSGLGSLTLFVRANEEAIQTAEDLRDALTKAIRNARREERKASK